MALSYQNLDGETRRYMVEEINQDISGGKLYMGAYLTEMGKRDWPTLILNAAVNSDDAALSEELSHAGRLMETAVRKNPKGGFTTYKVPYTAPEMLAEGEFNRFYARGLCRVAIDNGISCLVVYRARHVTNPRSSSEAILGLQVDPRRLLQDLRENVGVEPALGIPPGPNSGLSVRLP